MVIPKIIHYCWFGGKPLPLLAIKCIESWKKFLPDYEIIRWDESNFNVNLIPYTQHAYEQKKYAFVSDYARFWILYKYGGIYFDTDVEIIKPICDIISKGPFMACENYADDVDAPNELGVATGLGFSAIPELQFYKSILNHYESIDFKPQDKLANPETVVTYVTNLLVERGLKRSNDVQNVDGIFIYPKDYFCPISTSDGKLRMTSNTRTIHHYDQSWQSPARKYGRKIALALGGVKLKNLIKKILYKN